MDETRKDNIGFSLLTPENPLTVDNDDQDDAEAEAEQRRRQQELQSMMAYAFDDIGDENSTINSSFEQSSGHVLTSGHADYEESRQDSEMHLNEQYRDAQYNSVEQLQVLYQVQDREIKRLHDELGKIKEDKDKELTNLKRKILLMENDHQGTAISLKQCQDLLVEKKRDIDDHLHEINNLKDTIDNLTLSKRTSDEEGQMWKTKYMELEQKMNLIDQGLYVPVSERQIRNKYEQEISELRQNLEQAEKNVEKSIKAKSIAENETKELKQSHEIIAMEKEEQIHNLYTQLENSKFQCLNLTDRIGSLEKEYQNLTTILNNTTKEQESIQYSGTVKTLQQELKRSLDDIKLKREEIIKLEKELDEQKKHDMELQKKINQVEEQYVVLTNDNQTLRKDKEVMSQTIDELNKNIAEISMKLEHIFKTKLEKLELECRKVKSDNKDLIKQLENIKSVPNKDAETQMEKRNSDVKKNIEIETLKTQNEQLYKQLEETHKLNNEIELQSLKKIQELQTEMKPKITDKNLQILEEQYKQLKTNNEVIQKQHKDSEINLEFYKQQLEKYEKLCLELEESCANHKSQLYECHSKITELENKLLLKEKRDDLLEDLQQKALMFEQYMKNKSDMHSKSVNTEDIINVQTTKTEPNEILEDYKKQLTDVLNENKTLKEKIYFDRTALNELTNVWTNEINRLNNLVKELKKEIDSKNLIMEKRQEAVNEEITQMSLLINKLAEALRNKEEFIKESQEKESDLKKQQEEIYQKVQNDYRRQESRLLSQFETNMEEMKSKFQNDEEIMKSKIEDIQNKCKNGLEEINETIVSQMKYHSEKYALETKIIETYYDLLIEQAKLKNK